MVGRKKKIIVSLIGLVLLLIAVPAGIFLVSQSQELRKSAAPATTLNFIPAVLDKTLGEEFVLSLEIDTGENAPSAADVTVVYDPDVLELMSLTQGSFFSQSVSGSETMTPGLVRFLYYESQTVGPEAEGILASFGFRVKPDGNMGTTEVTIDKTKSTIAASDPTFPKGTAGNVLQTARAAVINVSDEGATATATPTVTPPPGATATATPTVTPTQTPELVGCWQTCTGDSDCSGDLLCESVNGTYRCVNLDCMTDSDCVCDGGATPTVTPPPGATATPTVTPTATPTISSGTGVTTETPTSTVPVTGFSGPTAVFGVTAGLLMLIGFLALAI